MAPERPPGRQQRRAQTDHGEQRPQQPGLHERAQLDAVRVTRCLGGAPVREVGLGEVVGADPHQGMRGEFIERHTVEVVAAGAQPAGEAATRGAVGGVALGLLNVSHAWRARATGLPTASQAARQQSHQQGQCDRGDAPVQRAAAARESVRRRSSAAPAATTAPTTSALSSVATTAAWTAAVALCRAAGLCGATPPCDAPSSAPTRSPTRSTAGAAAPIPAATGTSSANVRTRPGSSANTSTSITGSAYTEPRLWLSSATSASSTAPPASAPAATMAAAARAPAAAPASRPSATARRPR